MAPAKVNVPTNGNLPHAHRLPVTHREVTRTFSKLSRPSLISLALHWLSRKTRDFAQPYLVPDFNPDEHINDAYLPAESYEELQELYKELGARKGGRKEVVDRILEGDWRNGISMYQLATAEIQHLIDHPAALRWNAWRLAKMQSAKARTNAAAADAGLEVTNEAEHLPRFHANTFMANLVRELAPLMKGHFLMMRVKTMPITILRVFIHDSPYNSEASLAATAADKSADGAKSVFFCWPDGSPFVYSSLVTHMGQQAGEEAKNLRMIVQNAIPKAFSRPNHRYELQPTTFTTRDLSTLLTFRGPGKSNAAAGGWSIFVEGSFSQNVLDFTTAPRDHSTKETGQKPTEQSRTGSTSDTKRGPGRPKRALNPTEASESKRRKEIAAGRFGTSGLETDGQAIDKFEVRIDDPFPTHPKAPVPQAPGSPDPAQASRRNRKGRPSLLDRTVDEIEELEDMEGWRPEVSITFEGSHVFAGVRQLVEEGVVDGEKMPGWMTGEAGVTNGVVKDGRIRTKNRVPGT